MNNIELKIIQLKAQSEAFFQVEEKLKYDYEGLYDRSSIGEFFDDIAQDLLIMAKSLENELNAQKHT